MPINVYGALHGKSEPNYSFMNFRKDLDNSRKGPPRSMTLCTQDLSDGLESQLLRDVK